MGKSFGVGWHPATAAVLAAGLLSACLSGSIVGPGAGDDGGQGLPDAGAEASLPTDAGGPGTDAAPDGACTPTTCIAEGKNCGTMSDGCGTDLSCGTCTGTDTCGGGGTPNVCGEGTCTPTTCLAEGKNCGTISDGCSTTLSCGTCTGTDTCGGGGVDNVCGCTATTCIARGKNCGSISNDCGGTLSCGTCTGTDTCGGGGVPNVCGTGSTTTLPAGWLYVSGAKIYVADGAGGGTQWMGRGVNVDDIFLCGYNSGLWMGASAAESALTTQISGLMANWKPNFVRLSLSMNSFDQESWLANDAQYKTPMTNVINALGAYANTYVLVTLRSDVTMVETNSGNEATYIPQDGTDAVYKALVDSFANAKFVIFGISNEPGTIAWSSLVPVMTGAIEAIRAEEDLLGVPHHLIAVQGKNWTSDISQYATSPLAYDNIIYEVHGYPPGASSYTYSNIPVFIGEYGSLSDSAAFFADMEAKQIPNLAWDFEAYSDCAPDLLQITHNATDLRPTAWGTTVQNYLLAHAP
jgi:hypothetical protein